MARRNYERTPAEAPNTPMSGAIMRRGILQLKWWTIIQALAIGRFKWEGFPVNEETGEPVIDARFLEKTLIESGQAIAFNYADSVPMVTQVMTLDKPNVNDNFNEYASIGNNGWYYEIPKGEGIMIYDSMTRINKLQIIRHFSEELAEIDELARTNRLQQRNLVMFTGPKENSSDLGQLVRSLEMNETQFIAKDSINDDIDIKAINTGIPYLQAEFHSDRQSTLNNLYMYLGIQHIPFEKEERLLANEATIGLDAIARMREDALVPRRKAAEEMSKLFNTEITVDWAHDEMSEAMNVEDQEGGENGRADQEA